MKPKYKCPKGHVTDSWLRVEGSDDKVCGKCFILMVAEYSGGYVQSLDKTKEVW